MAGNKSDVAKLVAAAGGNMSFIDYETYRDNNKEFLRGDMWEFYFEAPPKIVYYPGDDVFKARLNQVNVGIDTSTNGFEKRMRGNFVIFQKTGQNTSGTVTLNFTDREDQAITYFCDDWRTKICDRDTKYSFRKDDLVAQGRLIITNSSRIDVRTIDFYNMILSDASFDENGVAEDGSDRAEVQMNLQFEHYTRTFNNLV